MSSTKYILDCETSTSGLSCVLSNWQPPPPVLSHYQEYGFSGTSITWMLIVAAIIGLASVIGATFVRYRRHERLQAENVAETNRPVTQCPNCMVSIP